MKPEGSVMTQKQTSNPLSYSLDDTIFDVIVIGGGAAGCMAAWSSCHHGANKVALLETTTQLAQKILVTGGGRCNFTRDMQVSEMVQHYPGSKKFLYSALSQFTPQDTIEFFKSFGITPVLEDDKYYAYQKAAGIQRALMQAVNASGVHVFADCRVVSISHASCTQHARASQAYTLHPAQEDQQFSEKSCWRVETIGSRDTAALQQHASSKKALQESQQSSSGKWLQVSAGTLQGRAVIFACGGASYPQTGSDGAALQILKDNDVSVHPFQPALTGLFCKNASWMHQIAGVSVDPVRLYAGDYSTYGPWLATHKGCSGKAVLDISRWFAREKLINLIIDFLPNITLALHKKAQREAIALNPDRAQALFDRELSRLKQRGTNKQLTDDRFYEGLLPERLRRALIAQIRSTPGTPGSAAQFKHGDRVFLEQMGRDDRYRLVQAFHAREVQVTGMPDVTRATVSTGGVGLQEITPTTCELKQAPGLYVCGEMLDIDGACGGYNLQAAWSTGYVAGRAAAQQSAEA